jgi:hypothetical protein
MPGAVLGLEKIAARTDPCDPSHCDGACSNVFPESDNGSRVSGGRRYGVFPPYLLPCLFLQDNPYRTPFLLHSIFVLATCLNQVA